MANYLPVEVYTPGYGSCSNNGVTEVFPRSLVVECEDGHITEQDVASQGYRILELEKRVGFADIFRPQGVKGSMFGGCFVWNSDSRFRRLYGDHPIAVHDRIES